MTGYIFDNKILYHPLRVAEWLDDGLVLPVTVEMHLSNRCNNRCSYCSMEKVKNAGTMSLATMLQSVDVAHSVGAKGIYLSGGGEPLTSTIFNATLKYIRSKGIEIGVITNGALFDTESATNALNNCKWIRISIDTDNKQDYKLIRGVDQFDSVAYSINELTNLRLKLKSACTIGLQIVVNHINYSFISDIVDNYFQWFDVDYVSIRPIEGLISQDYYTDEQLCIIQAELEAVRQMNYNVIISPKWAQLLNRKKIFGFNKCHAADFQFTIDVNGDMYLCCHVVGLPKYKIGNVNDISSYDDFKSMKDKMINRLGETKGFDPEVCFWGCRGTGINNTLESLMDESNHKNFV